MLKSMVEALDELPAPPIDEPQGFPSPEPSAHQDFLVYYRLGGLMLASALSSQDASEKVFALLHALVGKAEDKGVSPIEASRVRLGELAVEIESVEATEFLDDGPLAAEANMPQLTSNREPNEPQESFDVYASVARADLQRFGFDANQITDADMEKLARKMGDDYMEQLFWVSMRIIAEDLHFPKTTPALDLH